VSFACPAEKTYFGRRAVAGPQVAVYPPGAQSYALPHVVCHSTQGQLEWGYGGSGPADLALSVLVDAGLSRDEALSLHQAFKCDIIAKLPHDLWSLTENEVNAWIKAHAVKEGGAA